MKKIYILFLLSILSSTTVVAQKDTLVYYLKANGDSTSSREDAYCRLVIFPEGLIANTKLSPIKGLDSDGKLLFSGFSTIHNFPVNLEGPYTEYYPDGAKKSLENFHDGVGVKDIIDYYPNGNVKDSSHTVAGRGTDVKKYYENGGLRFEHNSKGGNTFDEIYYYTDGKVERKLMENYSGKREITEFYPDGQTKFFKTINSAGEKSTITAYYQNGKLFYREEKNYNDRFPNTHYIECRDSTGKVLVENGNGYWIEYNDDFTFIVSQGKVVNGYPDSVWTIHFLRSTGQYETYKKRKLIKVEEFKTTDVPGLVADQQPQFPGGPDALNRFIGKNLRYPAIARENEITGRVMVTFTVEKDGTLFGVKAISGIGYGCDEEVVRVIEMSPAWIPATKNSVPVTANVTFPVNFSIEKDDGGVTLSMHLDNH